jgi:hypothetical protein
MVGRGQESRYSLSAILSEEKIRRRSFPMAIKFATATNITGH